MKILYLTVAFFLFTGSALLAEEPSGGTLIELSSVGLMALVLATLSLQNDKSRSAHSKWGKFLKCFSKR